MDTLRTKVVVRVAMSASAAVVAMLGPCAGEASAQSVVGWGYYSRVPDGPVAQVAAGRHHTVTLMVDGSVACWGLDDEGQCSVPAGLGTVSMVAAGAFCTNVSPPRPCL